MDRAKGTAILDKTFGVLEATWERLTECDAGTA